MGNANTPRVTVFIPAYNAGAYLGEAIESILGQSFGDFELLIVDDGSIDDTAAVLDQYRHDPRVRTLKHMTNRGGPATRNQGFIHARGDYLALMDADDYATPGRLARQVAFLDAHPGIDILGCGWTYADEQGGTTSQRGRYRLDYTPEEIAAEMLFHCPIHQSTLMLRRHAVSGFRYDADFPVAQDYDLWSRMMASHRFAVLPEPMMFYRKHQGQITATREHDEISGRIRVQSRQLAALGLSFNDNDLEKHNALFQFRGVHYFESTTGRRLDQDMLHWARGWIESLVAANARHRIYPQRELLQILGTRWLRLCRKAVKGPVGLSAWREFTRISCRRELIRAHLPVLSPGAART